MSDMPYDHDALLDDAQPGNPPPKEYLDRIAMFDNEVRTCIYISRGYSGIRSPSARHYYASVLFTVMVTRAVSLAQLLPFTPWADKHIEHWDYASAAGILRTMLEVRIAFFYLCVDECNQDEWDCRWDIFNLHDCCSRIRLFENMGVEAQVSAFETDAEEIRTRLRENAHFKALPVKTQSHLLQGKTAYLQPLEEIGARAGIEVTTFRWLYPFLSSHVHALPMSFYRIGERGRGLPSPTEVSYTSLCVSYATAFLIRCRADLESLFEKFKEQAEARIQEESQLAEEDGAPKRAGMAVRESRVIGEFDDLSMEAKLVSEAAIEIIYRQKDTGVVVLRRTESDSHGAELEEFDPFFWNILINNKPATHARFETARAGPWFFKVDHRTRTLKIKAAE